MSHRPMAAFQSSDAPSGASPGTTELVLINLLVPGLSHLLLKRWLSGTVFLITSFVTSLYWLVSGSDLALGLTLGITLAACVDIVVRARRRSPAGMDWGA